MGERLSHTAPSTIAYVEIQGVRIHTLPLQTLLSRMMEAMLARRRALFAYVNVHALNLAHDQPWLRDFLNGCDVTYCDGFGVKWGARLLGRHIPYRYTPPDFFEELCAGCVQQDFSVYLLGARPGVAECAVVRLKQRFPTLRVVGTQHGYFDQTCGSAENAAVVNEINRRAPDMLIVCMGMPRQELWLAANFAQLHVYVALTAGALCDYASGAKRRAPRWMTDHGLEWLGRLMIEPRRLWRRYLIGNSTFLWRILRERVNTHHL